MDFDIQTLLPGIVASFLAAFIFIIFSKVMKKFGIFLTELFEKINKKFSNSIYTEAARNDIVKISLYNFYFFIILFVFIASLSSFYIYNKYDSNISTSEEIIKKLDNEAKKEYRALFNKKATVEELESILNLSKQLKFITIILSVLIAILLFSLLIRYMRLEKINFLIVQFKQSLSLIRPTIKHEEYINFKKEWALMRTKNDWLKIETKLKIKLENSV